ncbi:MAG: flagellar hook-associated protein FlgK [Myxococcota bacterium]
MGVLDSISIGSTGLRAAAEAINVVSHNTVNSATDGYTRQQVLTSSNDPTLRGGLWAGQGVSTDDIARITDLFINERYIQAQGDAASAEASYRTWSIIEASVATDEGVAENLSAFFDSLSLLSSDPSDTGHRIAAVGAADDFAESVRITVENMTRIQDGLEEQLGSTVEGVNDIIRRVAELNGFVQHGGGAPDLIDERDRLVGELAERFGARVDLRPNGGATVFIGGHAVVMNDNAREIEMDISGDSPAFTISADKGEIDITEDIGGSVGGILEGWEGAQGIKDDLDTFVSQFAAAFNAQHQAGYDKDSNPGGDFFTFSTTDPAATLSVSSLLVEDADRIALAANTPANAGDRGNLDQLIGLADDAIIDGETPEIFLSQVYTRLGEATRNAERAWKAEDTALDDASVLRSSISGVDLDEEAANLLGWQAAYQAASRVISASNSMLDELMNIAR